MKNEIKHVCKIVDFYIIDLQKIVKQQNMLFKKTDL